MTNIPQILPAFKTKEDSIYDLLKDSIINCDLAPGEKVVIDQLSAQLGVSSIPIRAALQRLGMEGLVEIRPHAPAHVASISLEMIKEIFLLLGALESVAYEAIAENPKPVKLEELENLAHEIDDAAASNDAKRWAQENIQFHLMIAELSGMSLVIEFTRRVFDQWRRLNTFYFKNVSASRLAQAQAEHWQIMNLLKRREVMELQVLSQRHNRSALESYQSLIVSNEVKDEES